ncbi:hypothetical protein CALCODRAFT_279644 [Calocera cornea HHB12733]|uniref:Uncharacterized protein n=1 Tax=Calocera cornea HHB12733 TaxID=1353952 RepID=A0A165JS01_9BASI|nr:hypothetical protein CALCODRAFT_279644 [Calocera cornea HHB12733]
MGDLPPLVASTQPPSTQPRVPRSHGESASGGLSHENSIGGPSSSAFVHPIAAERNFASLPKRAGKGKGVPQTTLTTFDGRGALDMVDPVRCKVEPDEDAIVQPLRVDKGKKRAVEKRSVEDDAASLPDASRKRPKLSIQSHSSERRATTPRRGRNIPTHAETGSWISVETSAPSLEQSRSNTAGLAAGTSGSSHNNTATVQQWLASTADLPPHVNAQGDAHGMGSLTTRAVHREGRRHRRVDANFMVESRLVYGLEDHNIAEADRPVVVIPDGRTSATNATALPWPEDSVQPVPEQPQPVTQQFQSIPTPTPLPVPEQPQYMPLPEDESEARQNPKPEPFDIVAWYAAGNFDYWTLPPYIRKAIAPHLPLKPPPCRERLLFSKGSSSRRRNVPNRERGGIPHVFGGSTSTAASSNLPHQFHGSTSTAASNDVPDLFRASTSTAASGNIPHLSRGSTSTAASSSVPYPFHGSTSTAASSKVVEDPYSELFAYRPRY